MTKLERPVVAAIFTTFLFSVRQKKTVSELKRGFDGSKTYMKFEQWMDRRMDGQA